MDLMGKVLAVGIFGWLILAVMGKAGCSCGIDSGPNQVPSHHGRSVTTVNGKPPLPVKRVQPTRLAAPRGPVPNDPGDLIVAVSSRYDVPAGAIYGIWMKESAGLRSGWGNGKGWVLAADMIVPGSECQSHYGLAKCQKLWRALEAICQQTRRDGTQVCQPGQVRTSYALAMGPMQHLPTLGARCGESGSCSWADHVVDYDGDGVFDPHSLPDAMASTAKLIRRYFQEEGSWQRAINRYYGSQSEGYFEGTDFTAGVVDHWQRWCQVPGNCRTPAVASTALTAAYAER